ncbi:ArsI/CadI family heavy metal resistance metalloenzyme [Candidatus Palauibacter sp.]|uniref:ArsI/CadI family heavy metal resistance metalloenzyme n=1 Tax=Candidatus Palauibacter sp. TaxID=3101350 RepID=UPI003B02D0DF
MRLQLALNVRDIDEAVDYYGKLFGAPPHKRRPGYANFAIDEPPLKLVLFEKPDAQERLNHLGVEVFDGALVRQAGDRLEAADILTEVEEETVCCHATQTKVWSHEPQGLRWEWYVVTDDAPDGRALIDPATAACATDSEDCCA